MSHYIDTPAREPPNKELIGGIGSDPVIDRLTAAKQERAQAAKEQAAGGGKEIIMNNNGVPRITAQALLEATMTHGGYEFPELNDKLYLHFKGYSKIEGLEEYKKVKTLFLESNGINKIENLDELTMLKSLFLHQNGIQKIENLGCLESLVTLNLSQNNIKTIDGLGNLPMLKTLNLSKNMIEDKSDIEHLEACGSIQNLDLSTNKLHEVECVEVFASMKSIAHLKLEGNPFVSKVGHYRKTFITLIPKLVYLDRPIFEIDRRKASAWKEGGSEAERAALVSFAQENKQKEKDAMSQFRKWKQEAKERKLKELEAAGVVPYNMRDENQRVEDDKTSLQFAMERSYEIYGKPDDVTPSDPDDAGGIGWDGPKKTHTSGKGTLLMQKKRAAEMKKLAETSAHHGDNIQELTEEEEQRMQDAVKTPGGIEELGRAHWESQGVVFGEDGKVFCDDDDSETLPPLEEMKTETPANTGTADFMQQVGKGIGMGVSQQYDAEVNAEQEENKSAAKVQAEADEIARKYKSGGAKSKADEDWERTEKIKADEAKAAELQAKRCQAKLDAQARKDKSEKLRKERAEREAKAKAAEAARVLTPEEQAAKAAQQERREKQRLEMQEEEERHQRVEDSLRIYQEQREVQKKQQQEAEERATETRRLEEQRREELRREQEADDEEEDWESQRRSAKSGNTRTAKKSSPRSETVQSKEMHAVRAEAADDFKQMSRRSRVGNAGVSAKSTWDSAAVDSTSAVQAPAVPPVPPPAAPAAPAVAAAPSSSSDVHVDWTAKTVQEQLEKAVRTHSFDFNAVATDLGKSLQSSVDITPEVCRMEFAKLAKGKRGQAEESKPKEKLETITPPVTVRVQQPAPSPAPELVSQFTDMSELD